jgi:hypothetical protein
VRELGHDLAALDEPRRRLPAQRRVRRMHHGRRPQTRAQDDRQGLPTAQKIPSTGPAAHCAHCGRNHQAAERPGRVAV